MVLKPFTPSYLGCLLQRRRHGRGCFRIGIFQRDSRRFCRRPLSERLKLSGYRALGDTPPTAGSYRSYEIIYLRTWTRAFELLLFLFGVYSSARYSPSPAGPVYSVLSILVYNPLEKRVIIQIDYGSDLV